MLRWWVEWLPGHNWGCGSTNVSNLLMWIHDRVCGSTDVGNLLMWICDRVCGSTNVGNLLMWIHDRVCGSTDVGNLLMWNCDRGCGSAVWRGSGLIGSKHWGRTVSSWWSVGSETIHLLTGSGSYFDEGTVFWRKIYLQQSLKLYCYGHRCRVYYEGVNPRFSSEEPDLGPQLTINIVVW